jgi:hypothetical protein
MVMNNASNRISPVRDEIQNKAGSCRARQLQGKETDRKKTQPRRKQSITT